EGVRLDGHARVYSGLARRGPPEPDDPRESQDPAVGDQPVPGGAQTDHGVLSGDPDVAGERQLEAAADRMAVEHADGELAHVLERIEGADPVPVEGWGDVAGGTGRPVSARRQGA